MIHPPYQETTQAVARTEEPGRWPSDELLMMRAQQIAERLNHMHNGPYLQFVFEQLKLVRMYASQEQP